MFLPHFSIRRPVTATVMVGALVIFGGIGLWRLGISLYPDVDFPVITVTATWENARPEEVDNEVTDQLEDAVSSVSGIKNITSQSSLGRSLVTVEFELSKDIDVAAQEVRDKVSARLGRIPREADAPVIDKLDLNAQPILWLALTGQQAIEELTRFTTREGTEKTVALVEAGATRLRPILMTAVSTVAGVGPVAVGLGVGSESRQPLAVAIAGGMISATFLTLAVVPVVYSYLDQLARWRALGWVKDRLLARDHPGGAEVDAPPHTTPNREASP